MLNLGSTTPLCSVGGALFFNSKEVSNLSALCLYRLCVSVQRQHFQFLPSSPGCKKTDTQIPVQEQVNPETEHTVYGWVYQVKSVPVGKWPGFMIRKGFSYHCRFQQNSTGVNPTTLSIHDHKGKGSKDTEMRFSPETKYNGTDVLQIQHKTT